MAFVTIGVIWVDHHTVFGQVERVDRQFLLINVIFLVFVAFIPFPAGLAATHVRGGGSGQGGQRHLP